MRIDRLEMLLQYTDQPQEMLAHEEWSFAHFNKGATEENMCGTCGCMAGGLPAIWPGDWEWRFNAVSLIYSYDSTFCNLMNWFDLPDDAISHLFYPGEQNVDRYGGKKLNSDATKEEVVKNLRIFIQEVKAGEIRG